MADNVPISPLPLKITTYRPGTDEIESERIIDHASHKDRVWLGKHCFWAVRNGLGVDTEPLNLAS